jgi:hypothetical protein
MRAPECGLAVQKVQQALIDLGYELGPGRDDSRFGHLTGNAVTLFKTRRKIVPNDPVVGPKTMAALDAEFALPYAERDEWMSWHQRPLRQWNFTRQDELKRRSLGTAFTFSAESQWLPRPFQSAIVTGLTALLDPGGSPDGPRTASATWGASPLDLFHCHVVVESWAFLRNLDMIDAQTAANKYMRRLDALRHQAENIAGSFESEAWTRAYRELLLARGMPSVRDEAAAVLNMAGSASVNPPTPVHLVWHSFEHARWRPAGMKSRDPRRHWWNEVVPNAGKVLATPFNEFAFIVTQILELAFLVNGAGEITVMAETMLETSALAKLPMRDIWAAIDTSTAQVPISLQPYAD